MSWAKFCSNYPAITRIATKLLICELQMKNCQWNWPHRDHLPGDLTPVRIVGVALGSRDWPWDRGQGLRPGAWTGLISGARAAHRVHCSAESRPRRSPSALCLPVASSLNLSIVTMAALAGKWKQTRTENMEDYLKEISKLRSYSGNLVISKNAFFEAFAAQSRNTYNNPSFFREIWLYSIIFCWWFRFLFIRNRISLRVGWDGLHIAFVLHS